MPLAAALVVAAPVAAGEPDAGRYQLAPGAGGFVRLDTRTGATSHCTRQEGVWRCQPVIEETGVLAAEFDALAKRVDAATAALAELGTRVDTLASRLDTPPSSAAEAVAPGESRGFIAMAVERLFALVRLLKHGPAAEG